MHELVFDAHVVAHFQPVYVKAKLRGCEVLEVVIVKIEVQDIDILGQIPAVILKRWSKGRRSQFFDMPGYLPSVIAMRSAASQMINERMVNRAHDLCQSFGMLDQSVRAQTTTDEALDSFCLDQTIVRNAVNETRVSRICGAFALRDV
ncbi:MAG: hypothetical protein AAGF36_13910 [Pseudomonadota bacterium]